MSASAHRDSPHQEFIADVVANVHIISKIYELMKRAAKNTKEEMRRPNYQRMENIRTVVLPVHQSGITRVTTEPELSNRYAIDYVPEDICLYGGSALTLYDYTLRGMKARHQMESLEHYVRKRTTDIDMVWWPRIGTPQLRDPMIITSKSPFIINIVNLFKNQLQKLVNYHKSSLLTFFKDTLQGKQDIQTLTDMVVSQQHIIPAGVHKVMLMCNLNGIPVNLCEISIHDSGSSQRYDEYNREFNMLLPMTDDPVYCHAEDDGTNHARTLLEVDDKEIPVPNLKLYIKQQLFAFINLIHAAGMTPKGIISYRRVVLLKDLLYRFTRNERNAREIKEKLGIDDIESVENDIDEMIDVVKSRFNVRIAEICQGIPDASNVAIQSLCSARAVNPNHVPSFIMTTSTRAKQLSEGHAQTSYQHIIREQERLQQLSQAIDRAIQKSIQQNHNDKEFMAYMTLYGKITTLLHSLYQKMQPHRQNHRKMHSILMSLRKHINELEREFQELQTQYQPAMASAMAASPSASSSASPSALLMPAFTPSATAPAFVSSAQMISVAKPPRHPKGSTYSQTRRNSKNNKA
jgi:hypothetical protein